MQDLVTRLNQLNRPRLLVRAAHFGKRYYMCDKHLRHIVGSETLPGTASLLLRLLDMEHGLNHARVHCKPGYSYRRHVEVLIALLHEAETFLTKANTEKGGAVVMAPPFETPAKEPVLLT